MKIAILSDIHDNLVNLKKFLNWCQTDKIETIICCGDITNNETLAELAKFEGPIYMVSGNIKLFDDEKVPQYKNITYFGEKGVFKLANKIIGLCHEPNYIDKLLINSIEGKKCDIIFYGHTHRPWEEDRNRTRCINPGTLSATFQKATFAVWETNNDNLELKLVDNL